MSRRIRCIKPEILEDEPTANLSDAAWRLFVSLWVLADDLGNVRYSARYIAANVWQDTGRDIAAAAAELVHKRFVEPYAHSEQAYAHVRGWDKHQRIDNAGKPKVPTPEEDDGSLPTWFQGFRKVFGSEPAEPSAPSVKPRKSRETYFVKVGSAIKIGMSVDVDRRLDEFTKHRPHEDPPQLLLKLPVNVERECFRAFESEHLAGEWFKASDPILAFVAWAKEKLEEPAVIVAWLAAPDFNRLGPVSGQVRREPGSSPPSSPRALEASPRATEGSPLEGKGREGNGTERSGADLSRARTREEQEPSHETPSCVVLKRVEAFAVPASEAPLWLPVWIDTYERAIHAATREPYSCGPKYRQVFERLLAKHCTDRKNFVDWLEREVSAFARTWHGQPWRGGLSPDGFEHWLNEAKPKPRAATGTDGPVRIRQYDMGPPDDSE